jgi:acetyl esterase/lipase
MKNLALFLIFFSNTVFAQNEEYKIYKGVAPGSEKWNWQEEKNNQNVIKLMTVFNVVTPTLTVFRPEKPNGTSVIICPGGGFHFLAMDNEGNDVAKWLIQKGITVFVLKYRVAHITTKDPFALLLDRNKDLKKWDDENQAAIPLSIMDGRNAISFVRKNAEKFKISPNKIGIIGFSAGGTVTAGSAFNYNADNRPDFIAPIYAYMPDSLQSDVKADAPLMFLVCATNDNFGFATHSIELYKKWYEAKKQPELHLYAKGGHGFGMNHQNLTSDNWIQAFYEWMLAEKLTINN